MNNTSQILSYTEKKEDILLRFRKTKEWRERIQIAAEYYILQQQQKGEYTWKNIPSKTKYLSMIFKYFWDFPKLAYTNPAMDGFGGFMFLSKYETYKDLPQKHLPKTLYFNKSDDIHNIIQGMQNIGIVFPCIVKPDKGEQSYGVKYIGSKESLIEYLPDALDDLLIQEYIEAKKEFGIYVVRDAHGVFEISSLVEKIKPSVIGDGKSTLTQLVQKLPLTQKIIDTICKSLIEDEKNDILSSGIKKVVARAGSSYVGVIMQTKNPTPALTQQMNKVLQSYNGFNIGRFDIIADSLEDVEKGNFAIIELNGASGIPLHIYDPANTVVKNHSIMTAHYASMIEVAQRNIDNKDVKKRSIFETSQFFVSNIRKQKIPGKSSDFWKVSLYIIRLTVILRFSSFKETLK